MLAALIIAGLGILLALVLRPQLRQAVAVTIPHAQLERVSGYAAKCRSLGFTDAQIRTALLRAGWIKDVVESALRETATDSRGTGKKAEPEASSGAPKAPEPPEKTDKNGEPAKASDPPKKPGEEKPYYVV